MCDNSLNKVAEERLKQSTSYRQKASKEEYKQFEIERSLLLLRRTYHRYTKEPFELEKTIYSHDEKRFHGELIAPKRPSKGI